jgi:AraC-like DNA-binding protein
MNLEGHFRTADPDNLVRLCERDPIEAVAALAEKLEPVVGAPSHWTDVLARVLSADSSITLLGWAESNGIRPDVVSQAFRRNFGVPPKLFRLESRTRKAWGEIVSTTRSLTSIAHTAGFSDLAHLSRSVRAFTGSSPSMWRREVSLEIRPNPVRRLG